MNDIVSALRHELHDKEYSEGYAESFLNSYIATQIKVLREQRGLSQPQLADLIGTRQSGISRIENVNYSSWNIGTLKKLARAFNVRLKVSFEPYGTLPREVENFSRASLQRTPRENDPGLVDIRVDVRIDDSNSSAALVNRFSVSANEHFDERDFLVSFVSEGPSEESKTVIQRVLEEYEQTPTDAMPWQSYAA